MISRVRCRGSRPVSARASLDVGHDVALVDLLEREVDGHGRCVARHGGEHARGVAAALAQDPAADRDDEPGLLGDRDELVGRHHAALGVVPAQQRLDARRRARRPAARPAGSSSSQLAGGERALQIGPQLQALQHALVHARLEECGSAPLPSRLAMYIAASASRIISSAPAVPSAPSTEMPMLQRRAISRCPARIGWESASSSRSAVSAASWALSTSSSSTANSSPPKRAAVSAPRTLESRRRATSMSTSSPAAWPRLSLISLKSSRSRNSTAQPLLLAARAGDRVAHALGEQRAVGEAGDRVVERLVRELRLEGAALARRRGR